MRNFKLCSLTISLIALFLLAVSATPLLAANSKYVTVKKDGVNIRSAPNTKSEILWEVFKDFPLQVIGKKGDWLHTKDFEGDKGWIFKNLVSRRKKVIVKVNTANLRVGPGTNYELTATVKYGVVFTPLSKQNGWIKVKHDDGTTGWIAAKLLWPADSI